MTHDLLIWAVAALATAGVIARPWHLPEAIWAVAGALLLIVTGLLPWHAALHAVGRGTDVYLFLAGMMLLSEIARREGLFDWLAAVAADHAKGSPKRLFLLIYAVGTLVTVFLSNDATAVVLTPAVIAAAEAARVRDKLPYLFVCAFVANAASFVLPISNPANLVLYGAGLPSLGPWLAHFLLPSALAILATYAALRFALRRELMERFPEATHRPPLSVGGRVAAAGIVVTAGVLLACSSLGVPLGLPTAVTGAATTLIVLAASRQSPWPVLRGVSWAVLPLVAGLFVLVEGLNATGVVEALGRLLQSAAQDTVAGTAAGAGVILALVSNLMNNLPAGLIAAETVAHAKPPEAVTQALLVGVDIGPNLSVTGSLATILWLTALRREGLRVSFLQFLRLGAVVMPPALLLALAALLLL